MDYRDIQNTREGFYSSDAGEKFIRKESIIVGIIAVLLSWLLFKWNIFASLGVGIAVGVVFPWLVGLFKWFAWVVTIIFSVIWGAFGYGIGYLIFNFIFHVESIIPAIIVAGIVFAISFVNHRIFAGLGYESVEKHVISSIDEIRDNTRR